LLSSCFVHFCHLQSSVFCCSIEETWALWQDFYEQCHNVEDWLSATEESLAKISEKVLEPGEDELMRVIVSLCAYYSLCLMF